MLKNRWGGVFLILFLQSNSVKSQSEVWSLGASTYDFNSATTIGNLPIGDPVAFAANYPFLANNPTDAVNYVYNGEKPVYAQNLVYDDNGKIKFFVIDGNIYDHDGILLANSILNTTATFNTYSYNIPEGHSEFAIVPVPDKCNSYYLIAATYDENLGVGADSTLQQRIFGTTSRVCYVEIDFNSPHNEYPDRMGSISYPVHLTSYSECASTHLAVTEKINAANERFLFVSTCRETRTARIKNSSISIEYNSPALDMFFDAQFPFRNEMEVTKRNGKFTVAKQVSFEINTGLNNQYIEIREFDETTGEGTFPSFDGRRVFYLAFDVLGNLSLNITGIEFSPSGDLVYVATKEWPYLWVAGITEQTIPFQPNTSGVAPYYYTDLQPVLLTVDPDYYGSQIETGADGKLYMYSGENNFAVINNPNDDISILNITYTTGLNLNNPASTGTDLDPGYFYLNHLLPDQIDGENYASFNASTPECCSKSIIYNLKDNNTTPEYEINTNTIWNNTSAPWGTGDGLVEKDIIVESGAKLTINGRTLKFSKDAKLIVKKGASLVLNNATLTSVDCEGIMWPGVEVWGTQGVSHTTQFSVQYGSIIMQNNSVISNAIVGITTCPRNANNVFNLTQSGGYINAVNSSFINNAIDVELTPHITSGFPIIPLANTSKTIFRNCIFESLDLKSSLVPQIAHVKMVQVKGVKFIANTFRNNDRDAEGTGIVAFDSKFYVTYACTSLQLPGNPCPEQGRAGNIFENLFYGITTISANRINNFVCEYSEFVNTHRGITMKGITGAKLDKNNFLVGAENPPVIPLESHGIYMENCTKYFCQNNTFGTNFNGDYGIITVNSGDANNEIRNNIFTGLEYGATATGDNFGLATDGSEIGLQYLCNEFYNSSYVDVQVTPGNILSPGIHNRQGACDPSFIDIPIDLQPANNTFSILQPTALHFTFDAAVQHDTYYHYSGTNNSIFDIEPDNAHGINHFYKPTCGPAEFPTNKSDVCPEREYTVLSNRELFSNITQLREIIASYFKLIDENNTSGLLTAINTENAGQLKNLLLDISPYLSDEVLLMYIASNPPAGHLQQIILANSPVSDEVMNALSLINLPNGIISQINAAQEGISPRMELMQNISFITFTKDGYSDELFRRYLNDTIDNKLDSLDYLMRFDPSKEHNYLRIGIKLMQANFVDAQNLINDLRAAGNANENYLKLMESLIIIYQCQNKAYRLNYDTQLKNEIEAIAQGDRSTKECVNATSLLDLLKIFSLPEIYEAVDLNEVRSLLANDDKESQIQLYKVYPNPANNFINIQTNFKYKKIQISLIDLSGKEVYHKIIFDTDYILLENLNCSKGLYFIKVTVDDSSIELQKIILD